MAKRILVVDDERSVRITMGEFLKDAGYEVDIAEGMEGAWELLASENFDVVLTDIVMPEFSGVSLLKAIKATSLHVQVILMTGKPTAETAADSVRAGAFAYLAKPFSKARLLETVADAIKVHALDESQPGGE